MRNLAILQGFRPWTAVAGATSSALGLGGGALDQQKHEVVAFVRCLAHDAESNRARASFESLSCEVNLNPKRRDKRAGHDDGPKETTCDRSLQTGS